MSKPDNQSLKQKAAQLTTYGSLLLIFGLLFGNILRGGPFQRVVGILLILASAVVFGMAIRLQREDKK